jgi:hypothetical protein
VTYFLFCRCTRDITILDSTAAFFLGPGFAFLAAFFCPYDKTKQLHHHNTYA